jgi:hypothetical protein
VGKYQWGKVREWTINHGHYEAVDCALAKSDREAINKARTTMLELLPAHSAALSEFGVTTEVGTVS